MKQKTQPRWMTADRRDPVYDQAAGCAQVVLYSIAAVIAVGLIATVVGVYFLKGGF